MTFKIFLIIMTSVFCCVPFFRYCFMNRKKLDILAPHFLPLIFILNNYIAPQYFLITSFDVPLTCLKIPAIGVAFYILGTICFSMYRNKTSFSYINFSDNSSQFIFFLKTLLTGTLLLLFYGYTTGLTFNILRGIDIEQLRRSEEIGRGVLKELGLLFSQVSVLWLVFYIADVSKKASMAMLLVFLVGCVFFLTTGHRSDFLWMGILSVGILCRYHRLSFFKVFLSGFIVLALIGFTGSMRRGVDISWIETISNGFSISSIAYAHNFIPLVSMVEEGNLDLQWGYEYFNNFLMIIPRFFWENKPLNYDYYYKDLLKMTFDGGGTPATTFGSFFLNFGFIGVVLLSFVKGFFYSFLYYNSYSHKKLERVFFLVLLPYLINPSNLFYKILVFYSFYIFTNIYLSFSQNKTRTLLIYKRCKIIRSCSHG